MSGSLEADYKVEMSKQELKGGILGVNAWARGILAQSLKASDPLTLKTSCPFGSTKLETL